MSNRPQLALGQIETIGLPTAVAAADAGVKSANVVLVGYELARGGGFVAVKFVGGVGAVQAAVAAAKVAATRVGKVARSSVIARPSEQIMALVYSSDTVGLDRETLAQVLGDAGEGPAEVPVEEVHTAEFPVAETVTIATTELTVDPPAGGEDLQPEATDDQAEE